MGLLKPFVSIFCLLFLAFESVVATAASLPEAPANIWDYPPISKLRQGGLYSYPFLPPFRTNIDGRIAIRSARAGDESLELFLIVPEKLSQHLLLSAPGVRAVSDPEPLRLELPFASLKQRFLARTLCDAPDDRNPQACGDTEDCYKLKVIGLLENRKQAMRFVSIPIDIRVADPKTSKARIETVTLGDVTVGPFLKGYPRRMMEPNITQDGRLWLAKFSNFGSKNAWQWLNPNTGKKHYFPRQSRPIAYSYNSTKAACDIEGWTTFHPLSHAPYDSEINRDYGFAHYPIRDPEGNVIADGDVIAADQYPWLSQDGSTLFFETNGDMLLYLDPADQKIKTRYPARCAVESECLLDKIVGTAAKERIEELEIARNIHRDVAMVGSWTHGKIVIIDDATNFMDYALNDALQQHLWVKLYAPQPKRSNAPAHQRGEVLMANNRQNKKILPGSVDDGAQLGSIENRFNYLPQLRTITPRDVVWLFSKGNGITTELVFDDFISPQILIYAQMNAAFANKDALSPEIQGIHNGFTRLDTLEGSGFDGNTPIRLQNAATSDASLSDANHFMTVPAYGEAVGNIRIEPYALGGVKGKGLWLDGNSGLRYAIPKQTEQKFYTQQQWYIGLFLDQRGKPKLRKALTFPDGSSVWLKHRRRLVVKNSQGGTQHSVDLTKFSQMLDQSSWWHLGLLSKEKSLSLYINGMLVDSWKKQAADELGMRPGILALGDIDNKKQGVVAWVDDFKVLIVEEQTSMEMFCEHAKGTVVAFNAQHNDRLNQLAQLAHANWSQTIRQELVSYIKPPEGQRYACFVNYNSEIGANFAQLPEGATPLREQLLQPQGLHFGKSRPDETQNRFCHSCHADGLHEKLSLSALQKKSVNMEDDPRRQPAQPLPKLFGRIPAGLIGAGKPSKTMTTDAAGMYVDQWIRVNTPP